MKIVGAKLTCSFVFIICTLWTPSILATSECRSTPVLTDFLAATTESELKKSVNNSDSVWSFPTNVTIPVNIAPWFLSFIGATLVGLSGIFPLAIPMGDNITGNKSGGGGLLLKRLLSFAVGGLLGDVFLHLLPEAWSHLEKMSNGRAQADHMALGLWVLAGILCFIMIEMVFGRDEDRPSDGKHISGYLNLLANSIDNFTHGLAVSGSFLASPRVGTLTTIAILLHELPHEVADFAVLLRAGFTRAEAAKAQLMTASTVLIGAFTAFAVTNAESLGERTAWILPFTSGGFLHIALVTVLPDLLREESPKESLRQLMFLLAGIAVMAGVTILVE